MFKGMWGVACECSSHRGPKRASDPLHLQLEPAVRPERGFWESNLEERHTLLEGEPSL